MGQTGAISEPVLPIRVTNEGQKCILLQPGSVRPKNLYVEFA